MIVCVWMSEWIALNMLSFGSLEYINQNNNNTMHCNQIAINSKYISILKTDNILLFNGDLHFMDVHKGRLLFGFFAVVLSVVVAVVVVVLWLRVVSPESVLWSLHR